MATVWDRATYDPVTRIFVRPRRTAGIRPAGSIRVWDPTRYGSGRAQPAGCSSTRCPMFTSGSRLEPGEKTIDNYATTSLDSVFGWECAPVPGARRGPLFNLNGGSTWQFPHRQSGSLGGFGGTAIMAQIAGPELSRVKPFIVNGPCCGKAGPIPHNFRTRLSPTCCPCPCFRHDSSRSPADMKIGILAIVIGALLLILWGCWT